MAFDINEYCQRLATALLTEFQEKVCYIGLQGSWLRGEATQTSDIDIMVILETLSTEEMDRYRSIIASLGNFEKSCGFICSKADLHHWNPLEVCQLRHTTKDIYGKLDDFLPPWTMLDEVNYIKLSLNNLYHALCHGYIYDDRNKLARKLPQYYKSAFFILQNTHFWETNHFIQTKCELLEQLQGNDKVVIEVLLSMLSGAPCDFEVHYPLLLGWCQEKMAYLADDKTRNVCYTSLEP